MNENIIECSALPERGCWFVAAENRDYLVVAKGSGLPSAPLNGGELSVFEQVAEAFPDVMNVNGKKEGEGGLIHRIDAETCGLLLIARNGEFFHRIEECRNNGRFLKTYTAYSVICDGEYGELPKNCKITSRFRPFGKKGAAVKPVFEESGMADKKKAGSRLYTTEIVESAVIAHQNEKSLVRLICRINEGFRHQVRAHLAYSSFPVFGDALYNKQFSDESTVPYDMMFFASGLSFEETDGSVTSVLIPKKLMDQKAQKAINAFTSLTR